MPPSPADSCAIHRTAADSRCVCTGTTTRFFSRPLRISPVAGPFPCGSRHKTADDPSDHRNTTNERLPRLRAPAASYHKSTVFQPCVEAEQRSCSMRVGNRRVLRFHFRHSQGLFLFAHQRRGGRAFIELRIPLGRHFIEERRPEPSCENDRGTTDKTADIHQMIRKCLLFP